MVPGFVQVGLIAVAFQLLIVGGFFGHLRRRRRITDPVARRRVVGIVAFGAVLTALGQLAALGALGSLWVSPALSFEQALLVQDSGLLAAFVGYLVVFAGFVVHGRAAR